MKPQQKVVTAQDVQSSLYYMHLDRPEDYELLGSFEDSDHHSDEDYPLKPTDPIGAGGVQRKPIPPSPVLALGNSLVPPPKVSPYSQNRSNDLTDGLHAEHKRFSQYNMAESRRMDLSPPLPDRKLLGPRPMKQRFLSVDNSPLQDVPEKQNIDLRTRSERPARTPPKLPPRPLSGGKDSVPMTPPRPLLASLKDPSIASGGHSSFLYRKPVAHSASDGLNKAARNGSHAKLIPDSSLSLIRRYNNEQWTVGKILSKGTETTVSGFGELRESNEISVHITTPGYSRFIDPVYPFAKQADTLTKKPDDSRAIETPIAAAEEQPCFQRHLQIPGHVMSRIQRQRLGSTDSSFIDQGTRPGPDLPRYSYESSDSSESRHSSTKGLTELESGSKKAYILKSPWHGTCEFTAGVVGRSFKCKHSYASSNPRFGPGMHSAQVSELRFNLPSSKALGSTTPKSIVPGSPRGAKRSSLFLNQHRRRSSSAFEGKDTHGTGYIAPKVELEERLDLSLGQEHAGGGFGGKQAKLGKLIIENEGLQMLDLIVAANMALWWRVYEKFT